MRFTFRTKLLASHLGLVAAAVLIVILELNRALGADVREQLDQRLEDQATGAAEWVGEGRRHPEKLAGRLAHVLHADVTIYDRDGNVVGESSTHDPGSAAPRAPGSSAEDAPELIAARRGEIGHAARAVGDDEIHFVAAPAADGLVVRVGVPLSDISATVGTMRARLMFALGLAAASALGLGFLASRIVSRPLRAMTGAATQIARGDYDLVDLPTASPDELGILSRSLVTLATDLKARIGDLTDERDRLSAIFAGMAEGVLVLDEGGRVASANPAASQILNVHGALVGKRLEELSIDRDVRAFIEGTVKSGQVHEAEVQTAQGDRTLEIYARPLGRDRSGVVTVIRDMTRVQRLLNMRRDFVANVSHELRTPVTAIQGYAETLLRGSADAATSKQFLEIIHRQARRLGVLVEGLLRLSELEARPTERVARDVFDVGAIAENVAQTVHERAARADVKVSIELDGKVMALGDAGGMEQVIENLVDNAIKYGSQAGTVRIKSCAERATSDRVVLAVLDDGPGIEAHHLPHLFERFYRVDPGRSRDRGGSGLGLAIVKHLVESMGGAVSVESDVGKGSSFFVELPRA